MEDIGKSFVQEFVLGFGFLSGLWIHIGVNPETEILRAFSSIINTLTPTSGFSFLFWAIPIIATLGSIAGAFLLGGLLGIITVFLAFLGGIFIESTFGVIMLIIAIFLGFIAPQTASSNY